jgi:hypothetical protein
MTLRELIGLVVAFAISNAFLARMNPVAASNVLLFALWNGMLSLYLGFAALQAWIRSIIRWRRTGDTSSPGRLPPRWTALGVAEATVIGGTSIVCLWFMLEKARSRGLDGNDWALLAAIVVITAAGAIAVGRLWRRDRRHAGTQPGMAGRTPAQPAP